MISAQLTIAGHLAADPELRFTGRGTAAVEGRVIANSRRKNGAGEWEDEEPTATRFAMSGLSARPVRMGTVSPVSVLPGASAPGSGPAPGQPEPQPELVGVGRVRAVLSAAAAWYRERLLADRPRLVVDLLGRRGLVDLSADTPIGRRWRPGTPPPGRPGPGWSPRWAGRGSPRRSCSRPGSPPPPGRAVRWWWTRCGGGWSSP